MHGSILKQSTMLKYLPAYFDFKDDSERDELPDSDQAIKQQKRQKVKEKEQQFAQLLKPLNIQDCDFASFPDPDLQPPKVQTKLKVVNDSLAKLIDGENFIDGAAMKFQLRSLNVIDIAELDVILVSTFNELYGLPFITRLSGQFKGRIYMTQPMAQMGKHLLDELVSQNHNRNLSKDLSKSNYFKMDKMHEIFAKQGIEEWQELYTHDDIEHCFSQNVKVLSYNETFTIDNLVKVTAISSGLHIGSCNWLIEVGQQRYGILANTSEEGDFRHPLQFYPGPLKNLDLLLVSSIARKSTILNYSSQLKQFCDKLQNCIGSSPNAKVLLPAESPLILEILDLLIHKISDRVKIVFIAESASQTIQYANINVEYLNLMLQKKIYNSEDPFSFDKLFKENRLLVFNNIQQYLSYKKERGQGLMSFDEYSQELIIASSPSLRLGDSVYWLHNLNQHQQQQSFMIITDPRYIEDPLLLKPFKAVSQVKVLYTPIDPNMTVEQIGKLIGKLKPKRVIVPFGYAQDAGSSIVDPMKISIRAGQSTILETIAKGERLTYTEKEIGKLKYSGLVPSFLTQQLQSNNQSQAKLIRLKGVDIQFQDNKYQITSIYKHKLKNQDTKSSLFFKMLEVKHKHDQGQALEQPLLFQHKDSIGISKCLNQIRVTLAQHGLKNEGQEQDGKSVIALEGNVCRIEINHKDQQITVQSCEDLNKLKQVSDIIKKVLKLI